MASPSPPPSSRPSPLLTRSPLFTPIQALETEESNVQQQQQHVERERENPRPSPAARKDDRQLSVLMSKCRPSPRDNKSTSVVPLDAAGPSPINPKAILHSFLLTLTRRSPRPASTTASTSSAAPTHDWRLAAQELSRRLAHANRKRDQALLESSRLKASVADLERKLDRLESYCLDLKARLDRGTAAAVPSPPPAMDQLPVAVSEARAAVRALARALLAHCRTARIAALLKIPAHNTQAPSSATLLVYMEALLNRVFFEDFEKGGPGRGEWRILDPAARCEANRAGYEAVRGLSWEEVLSKGTRHYSEALSRFCDAKMSEVVGMVGWARAWPEGLLQAFFGAAKGVWGVYLLARCVHPAVPIMRVERGAEFDGRYMVAVVAGERVRVMVAPGFYVHGGDGGVIKSRVVCGSELNKI